LMRIRSPMLQRSRDAFACLALFVHPVQRVPREDQTPIGRRLLDQANGRNASSGTVFTGLTKSQSLRPATICCSQRF
jgi:hypothetical protein